MRLYNTEQSSQQDLIMGDSPASQLVDDAMNVLDKFKDFA
jgi:hypothetical protein